MQTNLVTESKMTACLKQVRGRGTIKEIMRFGFTGANMY